VTVSDDAIAEAIRILLQDTHNLAEGAGAAPLAALMAERGRGAGRRAAVILCGQNIDRDWLATVLAGRTPRVG
jgi:threonine dehydratase